MSDEFVPVISRLHAYFALEGNRLFVRCHNLRENRIEWTNSVKEDPTKMSSRAIDLFIEFSMKGKKGTFKEVWMDEQGVPPAHPADKGVYRYELLIFTGDKGKAPDFGNT